MKMACAPEISRFRSEKPIDAVAGTTPTPKSLPPPLRFAREMGRLGEPSLPNG